jgi:peptidoglycan/LPS O-acetylase OafA/YrhL
MAAAFLSSRWAAHLTNPTPVEYTLLSFPFALLVLYAVRSPGSVAWTNGVSQVFAYFGLFSYSIYATHLPVLILFRSLIQDGKKSTLFISIVPGILSAILIGYVVFQLVERWSLKIPGSQWWPTKDRRGEGVSPLILTLPPDAAGGLRPSLADEHYNHGQ